MNEPCYYIPKNLITSEYANFSVESKVLFGIVLTTAQQIKSIKELSDLIKTMSDDNLRKMHKEIADIEKKRIERKGMNNGV